jgi:CDP-glycerol glycerophosphotransferase (TagB/SpsB family)
MQSQDSITIALVWFRPPSIPIEKHSLSTPTTNTPELLSTVLTNNISMEDKSWLNSVDKLLVDTNHKVELEDQLVKQTLSSSETLDSELNNGLLKNSSRDAVLSMLLESLLEKTRDQEVSHMLNLQHMLRLRQQSTKWPASTLKDVR